MCIRDSNYIVDRNHLEDADGEPGVRSLDEDNRVLNEGETVSMDKLMGLMKKRRNSILVLILSLIHIYNYRIVFEQESGFVAHDLMRCAVTEMCIRDRVRAMPNT